MNQACQICQGACCESIIVTAPEGDEGRWLTFHGQALGFGRVQLETPCSKLTGGKCGIWKDRPLLCQAFPVGGDNCRETVMRRRANWAEIFAAMPEALTGPQ